MPSTLVPGAEYHAQGRVLGDLYRSTRDLDALAGRPLEAALARLGVEFGHSSREGG
jgi:hypothetical protein